MRHYKIVSPVRFFLFVATITILLIFGMVSFWGNGTTEAASMNTYVQVEVSADDTLWSIASAYADDSKDVRSFINEIREINDIDADESIYVGELLFIPLNN